MFITKKYRILVLSFIFIACILGVIYYFTCKFNSESVKEGLASTSFPNSIISGGTTYNNVGCWQNGDIANSLAMSIIATDNTISTVNQCVNYAATNGYDTAGWQDSAGKCYVGNNDPTKWDAITNYTKYGQATDCSLPNVNVVYTTNPAPVPVSNPTPPANYSTYKYKGCYVVNPGVTPTNMTDVTTAVTSMGTSGGSTLMEKCVNYAKSPSAPPGTNTAIISGTNCYVATMGPTSPSILTYFNLVNVPSPTTTNYCGVDGTSKPSPDRAPAYMIYSSYIGTPPADISNYSYRGCYKKTPTSGTGDNALPTRLNPSDNTLQGCVDFAKNSGYNSAGLSSVASSYGTSVNECWGGNQRVSYLKDNYARYGAALDPSSCDATYPGTDSLLVYSILNDPVTTTINGYTYGGCWEDPSGNILPTQLYKPGTTPSNSVETMTLDECTQAGTNAGFNSVAYKKDGKCFGGNQGTRGVNYKSRGEVVNDDQRCDVKKPGTGVGIVYTKYGRNPESTILGYDYKGCWNGPGSSGVPFGEIQTGSYTIDTCIQDIASDRNAGRGFDTATLINQNQCILSDTSVPVDNYRKFGSYTGTDTCNQYYPGINAGVVYSTSSSSPTPSNIEYYADVVGDPDHPSSIVIPTVGTIQGHTFNLRGYWEESSTNRAVPNFIAQVSNINQCINLANARGYNVASYQNSGQCYGGSSVNYKTYGEATPTSVRDGSIIAEIYGYGPEPTTHADCGINQDGFSNIDEQNTANTNIPQPSYNTPQTTTVVFDPLPNTNTIITYSQTPNPDLIQSSSSSQQRQQQQTATDSVRGTSPPSTQTTPSTYVPSSAANVPSSTPSSSNSQQIMNTPLTEEGKIQSHSQWLPNTPFVYENKMNTMPSSSVAPPSPTQTSLPNQAAPVTDVINNEYGSSIYRDRGREPFSLLNSFGSLFKEGIESLSPPQDVPGLFVPKTQIVPPVCPSVTPIIIKQSNDVSEKQKETSTRNGSMTLNNGLYVAQNSRTSCSSGSNYGGNTDNIPQPYLPSFSGFGM